MGEKSVYGGKGVVKAVENINNLLAPELLGFDTRKHMDIDNIMLELDGTPNKGNVVQMQFWESLSVCAEQVQEPKLFCSADLSRLCQESRNLSCLCLH